MSLVQLHEQAIARMQSLLVGRGDIDESEALRQFTQQELQPALAGLARIEKVKTALEAGKIHVAIASPSTKLRKAVAALRERFEKESVRAALVDGKGWGTVKPSLQSYSEQSQEQLLSTWVAYCDARIPSETVEQLRADSIISLHPENREKLQRYEILYRQLLALKANLPMGTDTVGQFDKAARDAASLLRQLDRKPPPPEDIPPDAVRIFLQQVATGPVALDKVPPEALNWLRARGRLGDFHVSRRPV